MPSVVAGDERLVRVVLDDGGLTRRRALVVVEGLRPRPGRGCPSTSSGCHRRPCCRRLPGRLDGRALPEPATGSATPDGGRSEDAARGVAGDVGRPVLRAACRVGAGGSRPDWGCGVARVGRQGHAGAGLGAAGSWPGVCGVAPRRPHRVSTRGARDQAEPQLGLALDGVDEVGLAVAGDLDHDQVVALGGHLGLGHTRAVDALVDDRRGLVEAARASTSSLVTRVIRVPPWRSRPSCGVQVPTRATSPKAIARPTKKIADACAPGAWACVPCQFSSGSSAATSSPASSAGVGLRYDATRSRRGRP